MDPVILYASLALVFILGVFGVVFAKLVSGDRLKSSACDDASMFSPCRYEVMERLLDDSDAKLLRSYPGYNRKAEDRFRVVRVEIFRGYMHQLAHDFRQLCKALKFLMVTSRTDRPDLATVLFKQQLGFAFAMGSVEFKLLLYEHGWRGVDVRSLMRPLDAMRLQLQALAMMAEPNSAHSPA